MGILTKKSDSHCFACLRRSAKAAGEILAANYPGINPNPKTCPGIYEFVQANRAKYGEELRAGSILPSWSLQHLLYGI
jgi:hypothetical protein